MKQEVESKIDTIISCITDLQKYTEDLMKGNNNISEIVVNMLEAICI